MLENILNNSNKAELHNNLQILKYVIKIKLKG